MLANFLKDLPGFTGLIARHLHNSLDTVQDGLCIASALSLVSLVKSERVFSSQVDCVPNLFCAVLGESGTGKTKCQTIMTDILTRSGGAELLMGEPGTYQGVLKALSRSNRCLLIWDEFGHALSELSRSSNGNRALILSTLMKVYSANGKFYIGNELKGAGVDDKRIDIDKPHLSVLAASTPDKFYDTMSEDAINDGLFPRFLAFSAPEKDTFKEPNTEYSVVDIINEAKYWLIGELDTGRRGNLSDISYRTPSFDVKFNKRSLDMEKRSFQKLVLDADKSTERAFWRRGFEATLRVALTLSDSDNCSTELLELSSGLVRHLIKANIAVCAEKLYSSVEERNYDKWRIKFLKAVPEGTTVSKSQLTRKLQRCPSRLRNDILNELLDSRIFFEQPNHDGETFFTHPNSN